MISKYRWFTLFLLFSLHVCGINTPVPSSPANSTTMSRFSTVLMVNQVTGAINYEFSIDTTATFSSGWTKNLHSSIRAVNGPLLSLNKTYYWRARCSDSTTTSGWSQVFSFSIVNGTANLNKPAHNSTGPITEIACTGVGADSSILYIYEADTSGDFTSPLRKIYTAPGWLENADIFAFGRTIYWRATVTNQLGDTFSWSPVWKYTMHNAPTLSGFPNIQLTEPRHFASWTNAGLSAVELQLDSVNSFNSAGLETHLINKGSTVDTLNDLLFGKYYYFRIRAHYGNDTSDWSVIRTIQIRTNGYINDPPFNGATINQLSDVYFSWHMLNGTQKRVQLFADSGLTLLADTVTSESFFRYKPELELNTWYQLQLTYFHSKDSATPLMNNFRTYTGQVNLLEPVNNATNVSIEPRFRFGTTTWATGYVLEIDTGTSFPLVPSSYSIRITSFDTLSAYLSAFATLHYNQRYVWRAYAIKDGDTAGAAVRSFTTAVAPANYFPPNNFTGIGTSTDALVKTIDSSLFVQWELDTAFTFSSSHLATGTDPSVRDDFDRDYVRLNFPDALLFHARYYWRSRCISTLDTSSWSAIFSFTTTTDVQLNAPANGATNVPIKPLLDWSIQGSNLDQRYQYQIATDSLLENKPVITLDPDHFSEDTATCIHATTYYWRARAFNTIDTSDWSKIHSFRTINLPAIGAVSLSSPLNGAMLSPGTITFGWNFTTNATSYDVQVSDDENFSNVLASGNALGTGAQFSGAEPRSKYYWRVRGKNNFTQGPWSVRWFQTGSPVGIGETESKAFIRLYPNPAGASFTIRSEKACTIKVYNMEGKLVYENQVSRQSTIDSHDWAEGIYMISIQSDDQFFSQKITILRSVYE